MKNLGPNITPPAVVKAGKSIAAVHVTLEEQTSPSSPSYHHPYPRFGKDFSTVLSILEKCLLQHAKETMKQI